MSAEHQPHTAESTGERHQELEAAAAERLQQLKSAEHTPEHSADRRAEAAREIINREPAPEAKPEPEPIPAAEQRPTPFARLHELTPQLNYEHTLKSLQHHLKPVSRTFSKFIHQPVVERTSDALGATVARPSILNGALWSAVIVGAAFYFTARTFGYALSGSEMLFALLAGALIGVVAEAIWRAYRR